MRKLALCKACNKPLIWKQPYKKGDRPVEKDGSQHNCKKWFESDNTRFSKNNKDDNYKGYRKNYEYERCPYCKGSNYGYCRKGTKDLETHMKAYHPSGEILYDNDFKMHYSDKFPSDNDKALKVISDSWENAFQSF